jgi:hypothetical protein
MNGRSVFTSVHAPSIGAVAAVELQPAGIRRQIGIRGHREAVGDDVVQGRRLNGEPVSAAKVKRGERCLIEEPGRQMGRGAVVIAVHRHILQHRRAIVEDDLEIGAGRRLHPDPRPDDLIRRAKPGVVDEAQPVFIGRRAGIDRAGDLVLRRPPVGGAGRSIAPAGRPLTASAHARVVGDHVREVVGAREPVVTGDVELGVVAAVHGAGVIGDHHGEPLAPRAGVGVVQVHPLPGVVPRCRGRRREGP